MSLFARLFPPKDGTPAANVSRAKELDGKAIRYVTERKGGADEIVGRGGCLSYRDGEFILLTSGEILFRADAAKLSASYLLSGDGVVISGENTLENGKPRTLTAYFVYYRK